MRTKAGLACILALGAGACRERGDAPEPAASSGPQAASAPQPSFERVPAPAPRQGMAYVEPGALVAGTPEDRLPRVTDEEIPGEQVMLGGFYIDVFAYPNEEGAIPLTSVTQAEAAGLCAQKGKRLCSELEWERACKGPENHTYEYGDHYSPDRCGTGAPAALRPSGYLVGCRSAFGVRDLHGGPWEWTASAWGRGVPGSVVATRGGDGNDGELVGRCAHGMGRPPESKSSTLGFRCCAGEPNSAAVNLRVKHGKKIERWQIDDGIVRAVLKRLPDAADDELRRYGALKIERAWAWHPVGNEEIIIIGGCAYRRKDRACGVLVFREHPAAPQVLAWLGSGYWMPSLHVARDPRDMWLLGGDYAGSFKRLIAYSFGRVSIGPKERHVGRAKGKRG